MSPQNIAIVFAPNLFDSNSLADPMAVCWICVSVEVSQRILQGIQYSNKVDAFLVRSIILRATARQADRMAAIAEAAAAALEAQVLVSIKTHLPLLVRRVFF